MRQADEVDRRILRVLQDDATLSVADLARRAGTTAGQAARRLARLEADGAITGWTVDIDPRALGYSVSVSLRVTLDKTHPRAFDEFIAAAKAVPEIDAVQTLLGRVDVRLNIHARDLAEYQDIYRQKVLVLPHILDIEALMLVSEVKSSEALPL